MRLPVAILGAVSMLALSAPAMAVNVFGPGAPETIFSVTPVGGTIFTAPTISGSIKREGLAAGADTDEFRFTIPQDGLGSGSLSTSASIRFDATDLDFTSVLFNGNIVPITVTEGGLIEFSGLSNVPIIADQLNTLSVSYLSRGNGSYGGQLTFVRGAIPEPGTWAMFLAGFGLLGFALRRKSNQNVRVRYAF